MPDFLGECMKLVFCGTPEFAVPTLEAVIAAGHEVALVVTQPDRAAGRGMEMQRSAGEAGGGWRIGYRWCSRRRSRPTPRSARILESIRPDAIIVVAYGRIIPRWMLDLPRLGNINLHGSLLPKYRGAAPIQWADREWRARDRRHHDAHRRGPGYGRHAAGARDPDRPGRDGGGCV